MKIISSYKVRLQDNSNALATTAAIYQEALSLLIEIAEAEWAYLAPIYNTSTQSGQAAIKRGLHFGKSASDNGWGNFVWMLTYKSERKGGHLVKVDRWFPSSKKCSKCGYIHKELTLNDREYECPHCNHLMDRDHQAAVNIDTEGLRIFLRTYCTD